MCDAPGPLLGGLTTCDRFLCSVLTHASAHLALGGSLFGVALRLAFPGGSARVGVFALLERGLRMSLAVGLCTVLRAAAVRFSSEGLVCITPRRTQVSHSGSVQFQREHSTRGLLFFFLPPPRGWHCVVSA